MKRESIDFLMLGMLGVFSAAGLAVASIEVSVAEENFPDVDRNYWASPFIRALASKDIVTGYPDGTFRPKKNLDRDEFAAMVRQAFDEEKVRNIESGSVFKDVPKNYWASTPIEEAYESDFMKAYPNNRFHPKKDFSRTDALVALTRGLDLSYQPSKSTNQAVTPSPARKQAKRGQSKNRLLFPLAATTLMQPFYQMNLLNQNQPANVASAPGTTNTATGKNVVVGPSARELVNSYYQDAEKIPPEAIDNIAAATKANIVVNYPQQTLLRPNQPITRGAATALIHQALVYRGKLQPLDSDVGSAKYIIKNPSVKNQK
ncbi:S-layer homology domain-containing protein [Mastigocoleus testarum]|uniref:SLH domain-containing protein n=1 Tax=Mastigocoleus testarum BC008 TaxID=371196 RepID=A0A0V7ZP31_9CYAN|nr:S-layer homology domain-containing protein [Mastigocoleus testarum]KST65935.1 hypothetical protein BC008_23495 [Mastigocoleus testarum BC008]